MSDKSVKTTPLMDQYLDIKADYRDVILLYRMGDFYETFYEDAKLISKVLGIALTRRAHGKSADVPLAGFPYHALDNYLPKLLSAGHRVAICEQVEDPKLAKGVVKREVIEIASPGATLSDKLLDSRTNNYLVAVHYAETICGLAVADVSTGSLQVGQIPTRLLTDQLHQFKPSEILVAARYAGLLGELLANRLNSLITKREDWLLNRDYCYKTLTEHFQTHSLKGFGCEDMDEAIIAGGLLVHYLQENYKTRLGHFARLTLLNSSEYMILDESTRRNLELAETITGQNREHTLLYILDYTVTPAGARLFKQWIQRPLLNPALIRQRLDLVEILVGIPVLTAALSTDLKKIHDLERLLGKIVTGRANARDLQNLAESLQAVPPLRNRLEASGSEPLTRLLPAEMAYLPLAEKIRAALNDTLPLTVQEGGLIRAGFHAGLDELRSIAEQGKDWLIRFQEKERKNSGISSLRVHYNKVFGYYIEITNIHREKIPAEYIRRQTLVNAERYITPELKEWEEKILGAEDKMMAIEYEIFQELRGEVSQFINEIQEVSDAIARLDVLLSLAEAARRNHYVKPEIPDSDQLYLKECRHPVIEHFLPPGEDFIANDVQLSPDQEQVWIITGPNMAGKSTFLRQVGLAVLMTQIGSFVAAAEARIGIVDRIFTRVGASDNLARGESTFLVEMNETANILNNATRRSLILLDEIGRGTSTFDGLSIAWAVSEYIHNQENLRSKTLFATHYHELTELALLFPRIKNYNVAVEEWGNQVVFLRKIIPGGTDNSYGIHVAQMAGLPAPLIERAREILNNLESNELSPSSRKPRLALRQSGRRVDTNQTSLFPQEETALEKSLKQVDINDLTPLQALNKLSELKQMVKKR